MKKFLLTLCFAAMCAVFAFSGCAQDTAYGLTKKQYSEIYGKTAEVMLEKSASATATKTPLSYKETTDFSFVRNTAAFVYFLSELYKNNSFTLSEEPVKFTCSFKDEHFTITMLSFCDKENELVTGEIYCDQQGKDGGYINLTINYNFETENIIGFEIRQCTWETDAEYPYYQHDVYSGGKMLSLESTADEERANFITDVRAQSEAYKEKINSAINLNADFSYEYERSMQIITD